MTTIIVIILILLLIGVLPTWPYSKTFGPGPSGVIGFLLVIILVLWLLGILR
jgi:Protein of unknown function (DUF3309)